MPIHPLHSFLHLLLLVVASVLASSYRLDRDTAADCEGRIESCRTSDTTFLECPLTCATSLDGGLMVQGVAPREIAEFFKMGAKSANGKTVDFERFDGYVTLIAALPLMPGMAQYYYELTELFASKYPYTLATMILPFAPTDNPPTLLDFSKHQQRRSIVLETHVAESLGSHPIVKYLESAKRNQDTTDPLYSDRAILFVVSHEGKLIERRVCPNKQQMDKLLAHYFWRQDLSDEV